MERPDQNLDIVRRRLAWRASRRGIKEMDLLVGGFAEQRLAGMTAAELDAFSAILDLPDQDLLSWATGQQPVPADIDSALLRAVLAFRPAVLKA